MIITTLPGVSVSESKEVARLCRDRDWVNLEFIRANLVTFNMRKLMFYFDYNKRELKSVPVFLFSKISNKNLKLGSTKMSP